MSAVNSGDAETAIAYYNEHISKSEKKINKYRDIFSEKLDSILQDYTDTKTDFETAESQARVIKELNILPKANEVYDKILMIGNSRKAMAAGEYAEKEGDYGQALLEFSKVIEKSDLLQTKINNVTEKYKSNFEPRLSVAYDSDDYGTVKKLFDELTTVLPEDKNFREAQEQKLMNFLQSKIDNNNVDKGIELFNIAGDFISDKNMYLRYSELLSEAKSWADYANQKAQAKAFMVGKWHRSDGGILDGMIVECNGVEADAVGVVKSYPDTEHGFRIGDSKWSNIYVIDENTVHFRDMVKGVYGSASYRNATAKFNRSNNTISVKYDVIDGASTGQTQTWKKIK